MIKLTNIIRLSLVLGITILLIPACDKDVVNKEVLSITPELLVSYSGKNWNEIEPQLKNKKGYLYTTLNLGNTLAAISLPAIDEKAPSANYKILFNLDLQNRVFKVHLECSDTLDIATGNKLFLYYYDHAFGKMEGVYRKWVGYSVQPQPQITVDELLNKVRALNCERPTINFTNPKMVMEAGYSAEYHSFGVDISPFL